MTIAYVAGTTGPNSNTTSETLNMPTGYNTAGNMTIAAFCNEGSLAITPPTGWTTIAAGLGWWIGYRVFVSGDASSITASVATSGNFWMSSAVCYSGVDNTKPIDAANWFAQLAVASAVAPTTLVRAPSLNPSYTNDQLVVCLMGCNDTGGTFTFPGGLTQRQSNVAGPCMAMLDVALTSTAATGNYNGAISNDAANEPQIGVQIALKAAASTSGTPAVANVTQGGLIFGANNNYAPSTSLPIALGALGLQAGDLIVIAITTGQASVTAGALISTPSGYNGIQTNSYSGIYTHTWTGSGDNATPTFTLSPTAYAMFSVSVLRAGGTGTISVDTSFFGTLGTNTAPSPSLTPASTNEMLLVHYCAQQVASGAWSATPAGLTKDVNMANGPSMLMGWVEPVSSPTGSFSATNTEPVVAFATLIKVTPPPTVVRPPQQMCLT